MKAVNNKGKYLVNNKYKGRQSIQMYSSGDNIDNPEVDGTSVQELLKVCAEELKDYFPGCSKEIKGIIKHINDTKQC